MRIVIYDKNPGLGFGQKLLAWSWRIGCVLAKLRGKANECYGAESWIDAISWLQRFEDESITSVQYWGHGSPGHVWLAGRIMPVHAFASVRLKLAPGAVLWFRSCSSFQGRLGRELTVKLGDSLGCTVAGHTRIIGPLQGGLRSRRLGEAPRWPESEGELPPSWIPNYLRWGPNTVTCLASDVPEGW